MHSASGYYSLDIYYPPSLWACGSALTHAVLWLAPPVLWRCPLPSRSPTMERLNISANSAATGTCAALVALLRLNGVLTELDASCSAFGEEGCRALRRALDHNTALKVRGGAGLWAESSSWGPLSVSSRAAGRGAHAWPLGSPSGGMDASCIWRAACIAGASCEARLWLRMMGGQSYMSLPGWLAAEI